MASAPGHPPLHSTQKVNPTFVRIRRQNLAPTPRTALLLIHRVGIEVNELPLGTPLVVGREPPADVCIDDATLSRQHARFRLQDDRASVEVEDLGSTNGTWLGARRIDRAVLSLGDEAMLGGVLARIRMLVPAPAALGAGEDDGELVAGPAMASLLGMARRVAGSRIAVILSGETGTGKEVLARYIHDHGPGDKAPMISVNCGAIPRELIESTFFGHERGAFTGAHQAQPGIFESASGGTVFLDEIGELPLTAQVALLRVLETRKIVRVGATAERPVDVRVIAATHRDLSVMVEQQEFRRDLYFRLGAVTLDIPPLRKRREDIEPLARQFLRSANLTHARQVEDITPPALTALNEYDWPGNVRELRNVIERAVVLALTDLIDLDDLPERLRGAVPRAVEPEKTPSLAVPGGPISRPPGNDAASASLRARVQAYEAAIIHEALEQTHGSRSEAARLLGIPLRTLAHKIKMLGISEDD
jgi:DNA-binding NtrC family response regulator